MMQYYLAYDNEVSLRCENLLYLCVASVFSEGYFKATDAPYLVRGLSVVCLFWLLYTLLIIYNIVHSSDTINNLKDIVNKQMNFNYKI
jgi:hypothetical protein